MQDVSTSTASSYHEDGIENVVAQMRNLALSDANTTSQILPIGVIKNLCQFIHDIRPLASTCKAYYPVKVMDSNIISKCLAAMLKDSKEIDAIPAFLQKFPDATYDTSLKLEMTSLLNKETLPICKAIAAKFPNIRTIDIEWCLSGEELSSLLPLCQKLQHLYLNLDRANFNKQRLRPPVEGKKTFHIASAMWYSFHPRYSEMSFLLPFFKSCDELAIYAPNGAAHPRFTAGTVAEELKDICPKLQVFLQYT